MPPTVSTTPSIGLGRTVQSAEHETVTGEIQAPPSVYGFEREPPYLDHARKIANPRFHGRWQRPSVVVASDTPLSCNNFPPQPRKRSKFFADGKLIGHGGISAVQQPVVDAPFLTDNAVTTYTDATTPTPPRNLSPSNFKDSYDRLKAEHAWDTCFAPGARSISFATADASSLDTATWSDTHDDGDAPQRMSPLLECQPVDLDPPIQDYRRPIFNTLYRLEPNIGESIPDSDAAEYDMVSPVFSQDSWVQLPTPPQSNFDLESIRDDESDEDNDESY